MMRSIVYKALAYFSAFCLAAPTLLAGAETVQPAASPADTVAQSTGATPSYTEYSRKYTGIPAAAESVTIPASSADFVDSSLQLLDNFEGVSQVLRWETGENPAAVTWDFQVEQTGCYSIQVFYYPLESKCDRIEVGLQLDGQTPFRQAEALTLHRLWKNETQTFAADKTGNEQRPRQVQFFYWTHSFFYDNEGISNEPYQFCLSEGMHTLRLEGNRTDLVIEKIVLTAYKTPASYYEVSSSYADDRATQAEPIWLEGEKADFKSDISLVPMYDRSDAKTSPSHPTQIRYNTIGDYNWQSQGQWLTWKFNIATAGYYRIGMRVQQNYQRGYATNRRVYIDDKVPFKELEAVEFAYSNDWYFQTLGDGKQEFEFYLSSGEHTISMEVVPGNTAALTSKLSGQVQRLYALYRAIIMVTGTQPDSLRDYYLASEIPSLKETITGLRDDMRQTYREMQSHKNSGRDGDTASLDRLIQQMNSFLTELDTIPKRLNSFRDNISALSSWIVRLKDQALELDYIQIIPSGVASFQENESSLWDNLLFQVRQFVGSFVVDYNVIGNASESKDSIQVWVNLGRDQVQIIKSMVEDSFTPDTGIAVDLRLTTASVVQATFAGTGPDVVLFAANDQPVNLAARNALIDLKQFPDYEEVVRQYSKETLVPYQYQGGVYGLPTTASFNMMFYRTDIFDEMGLQVPQTWKELYQLIPMLQRKNLSVGLPCVAMSSTGLPSSASSIFDTLLLQQGQNYYRNDGAQTNMDTAEALQAFEQWTSFYTKYDLLTDYDFYNRFRTGEMPIGIESYTLYNKLAAGAPEISGQWGMAPMPGTVRSDGHLDRSSAIFGSCSIILDTGANKAACWRFISWFNSSEAQSEYGRSVEALLGPASRYDTANQKALEDLPWTAGELKALQIQWETAKGIEQIPASYYISRNLYNAFRNVTLKDTNPREALGDYNRQMNEEITRKRTEFGLS